VRTKKALCHAPPLKLPLVYVTLVQNITWSKKAESPSETIDSLITARKVAPERPLVQLKIRTRRECLNQVISISSRHHRINILFIDDGERNETNPRRYEPMHAASKTFDSVSTIKVPRNIFTSGIKNCLTPSCPFGGRQTALEGFG
jgi:hypothetical protein